jgi:transposase
VKKSRINETKKSNELENTLTPCQESIILKFFNLLLTFTNPTIAKRLTCLILLTFSINIFYIKTLLGISRPTINKIKKVHDSGSVDSLLDIKTRGRKSHFEGIEKAIIEWIDTNPCHSIKQIVAHIEKTYGVKTSDTAVRRLLKKHGVKRLKCGSLPAKADPAEQRNFYDNVLHPLMMKANCGEISLLFMDASHFVMGGDWLGYIYCKTRRFVQTFAGRMRYNVLGGLDFVTKEVLTVTNDSYITATQVCELFLKVSKKYAEQVLYIVLDNAKYQKCKLVQNLAEQLNIKLVYIPTYSPNLNLIERFWKYVKGPLRTTYFDNFSNFCEFIDSTIECNDSNSKKELNKLINMKVQFFDTLKPKNKTTFC